MDRGKGVDYASKEYWDERYKEEEHFEWISNGYEKQLDAIVAKIGSVESRILVVGCGNSRLSVDLRSRGQENITSTDFSEVRGQILQGIHLSAKMKATIISWMPIDNMWKFIHC